jgi:hypothetical protein
MGLSVAVLAAVKIGIDGVAYLTQTRAVRLSTMASTRSICLFATSTTQIRTERVVICSPARNFARATFPRVYSDRDCSRGLHTDAAASAGGAEPERRACRQTPATLAGRLQ